MKRLIIAVLLILALCGCEADDNWPYVHYQASIWNLDTANRNIAIWSGYVLNPAHRYDEVETENGYDLVLHFVKEDTDVH